MQHHVLVALRGGLKQKLWYSKQKLTYIAFNIRVWGYGPDILDPTFPIVQQWFFHSSTFKLGPSVNCYTRCVFLLEMGLRPSCWGAFEQHQECCSAYDLWTFCEVERVRESRVSPTFVTILVVWSLPSDLTHLAVPAAAGVVTVVMVTGI